MVEEASRRRIGELKVNGTVCGNAISLPGSVRNRYRIPLDTQPPRNERGGGRDAIRKSMEFGHPLVTLWSELFYFLGVAPRPLCFPPPCRAASVLHPFCSTRLSENFIFYSFSFFFLFFDFDDADEERRKGFFLLIRNNFWDESLKNSSDARLLPFRLRLKEESFEAFFEFSRIYF